MFTLIAFLNVFKAWTGRGMGNLNHFGDIFNPFHASVLFLYSLKTSEKLWFPVVFRGYKNGILAWNGLNGNCHIKQATLMKTSLHIRNVSFVSKPKSIFKTEVSLLYKETYNRYFEHSEYRQSTQKSHSSRSSKPLSSMKIILETTTFRKMWSGILSFS